MDMPKDRSNLLWDEMGSGVKLAEILQAALRNSAEGLSQMVGKQITIETPCIEAVPIGEVPHQVGGPETEMVGIYLLIEGDLPGQVILMFPLSEALHLVDLLMDLPSGTTTEFGELERSALAETGNITASFFINEVARQTQTSSRPSPPAVIIDMLGAILNIIASPIAMVSEEMVIVETTFREAERTVVANFWVMPYPTEIQY